MVCEGLIWRLTAESCVYYRWNNLSNNDTTSGTPGRWASVRLRSRSPSLPCSFNAFTISASMYTSADLCLYVHACVPANMHITRTHVPPVVTKKHFQWFVFNWNVLCVWGCAFVLCIFGEMTVRQLRYSTCTWTGKLEWKLEVKSTLTSCSVKILIYFACDVFKHLVCI